jgi:capsular polysaccharide biosynthesis protein
VQLNEIAGRIFGEHTRLIAALVLGGLFVGLLVQATSGRTYTASARLVLDTEDPESPSESKVIADTAKAIATAPEQVRAALAAAHVRGRSPTAIAKDRISIRALGTSAVLKLSVSDRDRHVAAAVTNALAERVIEERTAVSNGRLRQVLSRLQERINGLNAKVAALNVQADALAVQLAHAGSAEQASSLRSQHDDVLQSRDLLIQRRSVVESERISLLSAGATRPRAGIISRATVPAHADAAPWLKKALSGALLGLIVAIGAAAAIETIRPTVAGSENLAKLLGAPLIGVLRSAYPGELRAGAEDLTPLSARLRLVGDAAGARDIGLVPADPSIDLTGLAIQLAASPRALQGVKIHTVDLDEVELDGRREAAVVLVSPTALKRRELLALERRLSLLSATLLGLITYREQDRRRWPWSKERDRVAVVASD